MDDLASIIRADKRTVHKVLLTFFSMLHFTEDDTVFKVSKLFSIHKINTKEFALDVDDKVFDDPEQLFEYVSEFDRLNVDEET